MNFRPEPCRVTFCVTSFHEPGGPAILTNFPRKFVPDVRFLRDQLGTEETGWVIGGWGFRGEREREREKGAWNRGIQEKLGVDTGPSIPRRVETFNASLELGWTARRKGDDRAEIEFPGIFRSRYVRFTLSPSALSVSSFYAPRLARKSVIFHDIFFATKKRRRPLRRRSRVF